MDNITHSLMGAAIARSGFQNHMGCEDRALEKATWIGILSANLPDIDLVAHLWMDQPNAMYQHRGITHSLVGWVVGSVLLTFLIRLRWKDLRPLPVLVLCLLGIGSHIFMDLTTSWGTMLYQPFSDERLALNWLFIVDLIVIAFLVAPWVLRRWLPEGVGFRGSLLVCLAYICMCGFSHQIAQSSYLLHLEQQQIQTENVQVFPAPFAPFMWTATAHDENLVHVGYLSAPFDDTRTRRTWAHNLTHPAVIAFRNSEQGHRYFWWVRAPAARLTWTGPSRLTLELSDLRFYSALSERMGWKGFRYQVDMAQEHNHKWRVVSQGRFLRW